MSNRPVLGDAERSGRAPSASASCKAANATVVSARSKTGSDRGQNGVKVVLPSGLPKAPPGIGRRSAVDCLSHPT